MLAAQTAYFPRGTLNVNTLTHSPVALRSFIWPFSLPCSILFNIFCSFTLFLSFSLSLLSHSHNNLLSWSISDSLTQSLIFTSFLLVKAFTSFTLHLAFLYLRSPPTALLLPTSPLLPLTLLLRIVLCFLAIHPLQSLAAVLLPVFSVFLYPFSPSLLTFHLVTLSPSGCSVNFHIFLLYVSFPLFLSFCLVCPWGNLSTTVLSVTALPHHLLSSFFPPLPPLPLSFCLVSPSLADSAALHISLPFLLLRSVTNYTHICAHTPSDPTCHTHDFVLSSAVLCLTRSLLALPFI